MVIPQWLHVAIPRRFFGSLMSSERRDSADALGRASMLYSRLVPTASAPSRRTEPFIVGDVLRGSSGQNYVVEEILLHRKPLPCVYRARHVFHNSNSLGSLRGLMTSYPPEVLKGTPMLSKVC